MGNPSIEVLADKSALVKRATVLVLEKIQSALQERGQCTLVLAGGSTPKPLYEAIAAQSLPWDKIHVFWGDERYVPHDHPDSNYNMARKAWLERVDFPEANIHAMPTGAKDATADAHRHDRELQGFFGVKAGEFPRFDIILLGMGDDGHTASLFPQTEVLQVCDRLVAVGNKSGQPRLTFTIPLINRGRCVIFLAAGANKQNALAHVWGNSADPKDYPSRFIQPEGELWWFVDEIAARDIEAK
ncbi:6-phosphogluconolactonase [Spirulina sp. 06S082]|uniref:6-phosphogluconolactonase n=1 Tax=Spirulina sp. 06S082 TaxID=3110248 RepID=UPI002B219B82|nr:6-phosphogluconolactonase [Spirulina sp. 06S082]MEA5471634.1 6-phosphogluconolactonase [Spirulina sp. 06S082]